MNDIKKTKAPEEPVINEQVVLSKEQFDQLLAQNAKLAADVNILKKSVSRSRLEENEAKEKAGKTFSRKGHVLKLNGKPIVKWFGKNEEGSKAKSEILYNGTTPMGEVLQGHYVTIDGEEIVCPAINFYRSTDIEFFTILENLPNGNWLVKFDNPDLPQSFEFNPIYNNA